MLPLLERLQAHRQYRVLGWYDSVDHELPLRALFPDAQSMGSPADLMQAPVEGVVIVGRGGDWRGHESVLRELARIGVPLILVQPACSAIFAFELDMIQRDTGALMMPFHTAAFHPAIDTLARWVANPASSPVGTTEQIVLERTARDRSDEAVWSALARDGLLLRRMLGDFRQVGAMQASDKEPSLANLSVHLNGEFVAIARWSMGPAGDRPEAVLTLVGTDGRATLHMPDPGAWTLTTGTGAPLEDFSAYDPAAAVLRHLKAALENADVSPNWEDACRAMDLADLAGESVRRGKTLAVHNEQLTEEGTFKTIMAAGGCLLLMSTLFFLLVVTVVEGLELPIRQTRLWKTWPIVLFTPLAIFLGMQFLRMLFPRTKAS